MSPGQDRQLPAERRVPAETGAGLPVCREHAEAGTEPRDRPAIH
jgi:hypothetical protein